MYFKEMDWLTPIIHNSSNNHDKGHLDPCYNPINCPSLAQPHFH